MELTREEIDVVIKMLEDIDMMCGLLPKESALWEKIKREVEK